MLIALQTILACLVSVGYVPFVFLVGLLEGATLCCGVVVPFVVVETPCTLHLHVFSLGVHR